MDIALAIEALLPSADYFGSTTGNQKVDFDDLVWNDSRTKPTWQALQSAYDQLPAEIKTPTKP
jgi:hypothetical protein